MFDARSVQSECTWCRVAVHHPSVWFKVQSVKSVGGVWLVLEYLVCEECGLVLEHLVCDKCGWDWFVLRRMQNMPTEMPASSLPPVELCWHC